MAKKDNALKAFMLVQQLDDIFWMWAKPPQKPDSNYWDINDAGHIYVTRHNIYLKMKEALASARTGDVSLLAIWVAERLLSCGVQEVHVILHDKDTQEVWDEAKCVYQKVLKKPHVHIVVIFTSSKNYINDRTLENVAKALGVEPQYIERPGRGRYAVDNMLAYLVHIKYADKYQYKPEEVVSYIPIGSNGETYASIYSKRRAEWMRGRGQVSKKKAEINIDSLIDDIAEGKLTKQQILLTDDYLLIYSRNRRKINDAFAAHLERKVLQVVNDMRAGKFRLSVFFITGEAGKGKSALADLFAHALQVYKKNKENEEWQIYDAAATNGMDDYNGEEILIMDDLRAGAMKAEDWLRLLDNHRTKPASARFYNKTPICKTLVITSIKSPLDFFDDCARTSSEDLNQFIRRITACVEVVSADEFERARLTVGEVKKVAPYYYGFNETPLVYGIVADECEYTPISAIKRLMGIVLQSSKPTPPLLPVGWEKEILENIEDISRIESKLEQLSLSFNDENDA